MPYTTLHQYYSCTIFSSSTVVGIRNSQVLNQLKYDKLYRKHESTAMVFIHVNVVGPIFK